MPEPVRSGQRYLPGLDGLRALAVLAVIAYHEQFGWAPGGLLGVGVFFTLSGYLITDLLLGQWTAHGGIRLGDFWLRRARRLLPALFVMLAVVTAWVTVLDRSQLAGMRSSVAAAVLYVSNWFYIGTHSSYFSRFAPPAPLDHLWSLAVEEQFYLVWPWLLLLGLFLVGRRRARQPHRHRDPQPRWLAVPTLALAAVSVGAMVALYHPGVDPTRVYEGTDTRAFGLLIGAALAMAWPSRRAGCPRRLARIPLEAAGFAGLAVIGWLIWRVGQYSPFVYPDGLLLLTVATAAVVAAAAAPGSVVGAALGWRPLRWVGVRSYGIYLWHYPVIVLTSPANSTGVDLPRAAAQIGASIVAAALSWRFVEEPIRHGALGRLWSRARSSGQRARPAGVAAWVAMTGASSVLVVACGGLAGVFPGHGTTGDGAGARTVGSSLPPPPAGSSARSTAQASSARPDGKRAHGRRGSAAAPGAAGASGALSTSCQSVAHIGDSTSEGMISPEYLPNRSQRMTAQYNRVGVKSVYYDISGARSVVETLPGQVNGYDAAMALVKRGFRGCWVIALGTNDTADVVVGSPVGRMARIQRMMAAAHGEPVMWVNVVSLLANGPYAESEMVKWDNRLLQACSRYPNMRVYNWASVAQRSWFINDGIHYTSFGYAERGRLIANALANAFPLHGKSPGCVVS